MSSDKVDRKAIMNVMKFQEEAWSKGNIDGFMEGYWKSDSLMFIGSKGITYGWQNTLDNYKAKYDSKEKMGKLTFEVIKLNVNVSTATMIGKWNLERGGELEDVGGHFTLFWRKEGSKWRIVADHTS